ncbi:MAG TPA: carboxypeptidase regulatory-like domain-containing protein, partial [Granulicella sp.]|nr:carboxypeptidase regulatory-like domain-containing protein [Granulicella sp.]
YLEDTFHLAPRFLVRAGFRSDSSSGWSEAHGRAGVYSVTGGMLSTNPTVQSHIVDDNRALFLPEPHLGFTWDVFGDGKTDVRGGAGLYHSPLQALDYRLDEAAPFNTANAYNNSSVAAATDTTPIVLPSSVDTSIATPALFAYSLTIEQQITPKTLLAVGYVGSHSYHQILAGDLNEPPYTVLANNVIYYPTTTKSNPQLASTLSWWSGGTGNYNALTAELRQDLSHAFHLRADYTWSKNLDDGAAWTTSISANTPAFVEVASRPRLDYGPSATDIRNVAAVNASYDLPFGKGQTFFANSDRLTSRLISGWSLSTIGNLQSGFAFSPQLGYNPTASGDPRNPVRPNVNPNFSGRLYTHGTTAQRVAQYFNPAAFSAPAYGTVGNARRDSLLGPGHANWDLSLLKSTPLTERTRLQFRAEVFNVFNHTNLQVPNEIVYTNGPAQGTASAQTTAVALGPGGLITGTADSSRQIQLSLQLVF